MSKNTTKAASTNKSDVSGSKKDARFIPSFDEAEVFHPKEADVGEIVQSVVVVDGGLLEKPYRYFEPLDKPKTFWDRIMYKRLFFSNLVLSVVIVFLWMLFGYLYSKFFYTIREN